VPVRFNGLRKGELRAIIACHHDMTHHGFRYPDRQFANCSAARLRQRIEHSRRFIQARISLQREVLLGIRYNGESKLPLPVERLHRGDT
jgi:hypothetical protein